MAPSVTGIHHITAIAGDPQANLDFYAGLLGLRLVKKTVNFDDPGTYHFYYGDETGSPGTILTFFPFGQGEVRGSIGAGQACEIAFSVPPGSLVYWERRLRAAGVAVTEAPTDEWAALRFHDPDGMRLALVESGMAAGQAEREQGSVPGAQAIRRLCGVTAIVRELAPTADTLLLLGFRQMARSDRRARFIVGEGAQEASVVLLADPSVALGRVAVGSVHHLAWRAADDGALADWRARVAAAGLRPTDIVDRQYFHSVYFREPGGILFELATDPPGFLIDEEPYTLGTSLKLPSWLETRRGEIEAVLPPVMIPTGQEGMA